MFNILIYSDSQAFRDTTAVAVKREIGHLTEPIRSEVECYPFHTDDDGFAKRVAALAETAEGLIIISDRFGSADPAGGPALAERLRKGASGGVAIPALMAIVDAPVPRIIFVDSIVEYGADQPGFAEAFRRMVRAIRYRLPPAPQQSPLAGGAVEVRAVETVEDFRACLALRHDTYGLLGYAHDSPGQDACGLELDYYDQSALHFVALASGPPPRPVVGTARLVLAKTTLGRAPLFGNAPTIRACSTKLCDAVAGQVPYLKKKLQFGPGANSLPLFVSFPEIAPRDTPLGDFCEMSRVVVSEDFRGLGVSRLLVRASTAAAVELQHRYIVLECIPQHVTLYERLGFAKIKDVKHRRAWGVDQLAIVMRLDLTKTPDNIAVHLAKNDGEMLAVPRQVRSRPSLCLCRNAQCWRRGAYDQRGRAMCPLRGNFIN